MKAIELSQQELVILINSLNNVFKHGEIGLGDAIVITPLAMKLQSYIEPEKEKKPN